MKKSLLTLLTTAIVSTTALGQAVIGGKQTITVNNQSTHQTISHCGTHQCDHTRECPLPDDSTLRKMAARMLMVGFKGDTIKKDNPVIGYVRDLGVGAIILFDVDLTGAKTVGSRNITSRGQLQKLTADLRALAGDRKLLIAADQEGGLVQRLKPRYGFTKIPTARYIGQVANDDTTRYYASVMARELAESGVNVNLAPETDIHRADCPVIGGLDRAFATDPDSVARFAALTIDEMGKQGVTCVLKHFPGHGSATSDSHYGLTDVTATWDSTELVPFKRLIDGGYNGMIMTAHIFNRQLDEEYPATLSRKMLTEVLREKLGFKGVILTDDMYMQGIIDNYAIEDAIVAAINAGADMMCMGNNITTGFEADRPAKVVDIIVKAVKEGRIPVQRIIEANARIEKLREWRVESGEWRVVDNPLEGTH